MYTHKWQASSGAMPYTFAAQVPSDFVIEPDPTPPRSIATPGIRALQVLFILIVCFCKLAAGTLKALTCRLDGITSAASARSMQPTASAVSHCGPLCNAWRSLSALSALGASFAANRTLNLPARLQEAPKAYAAVPNTSLLITAGHYDNSVRVFALQSGALLQAVTAHSRAVACLHVTPGAALTPKAALACFSAPSSCPAGMQSAQFCDTTGAHGLVGNVSRGSLARAVVA